MRRLLFLIVLGLAFCLAESSAQGGFVLYTNRADFDAATHGRTTIDFEGIAPDGSEKPVPAGGILGVNFTTTANGGLTVDGKGFFIPGTSVLVAQDSITDPDTIAKLPGSFTAFGVDFGAFWGLDPQGTADVTFTLSTGDTFTLTTNNADYHSLGFIGLVSTDPFDSVTMSLPAPPPTGGNANLVIDNLTFGSGGGLAVVPAPSSGVLMVIGLATILGYAARPSRRVAASA